MKRMEESCLLEIEPELEKILLVEMMALLVLASDPDDVADLPAAGSGDCCRDSVERRGMDGTRLETMDPLHHSHWWTNLHENFVARVKHPQPDG